MPTPRRKVGRPRTERIRTVCTFSDAGLKRLDYLRKKKARGIYLEGLVMKVPLDPFESFRLLKK
jgi:hypothetical protein